MLATTNQDAQHTDLVEESDYLEELEYDWEYTLKHSINNISNKQSVAYSAAQDKKTQR